MEFKGQSAIEYLSTYGWMLVVVALAATIFYDSYIPQQQCTDEVTSSMSNQLQIADMATDSEGDLALLIRNMGAHRATVQEITVSYEENSSTLDTNVSIEPVEDQAFRLNGTAPASSCNEVDVEVLFNSTELGVVQDSGKIQGEFTVS